MTTKKKLLVISIIGILLFIALMFSQKIGICDARSCIKTFDDVAIIFFPFLPLFLFSLITYCMTETIFQAWWKFARIATPVSMGLILIAPSYSHDWMFPIEKGSVAMITTALFIFLSIIIIIRAYRRAK